MYKVSIRINGFAGSTPRLVNSLDGAERMVAEINANPHASATYEKIF